MKKQVKEISNSKKLVFLDLQIPMEMNIFALQLDLNLDIQFQNTTLISNRDNSTGREGQLSYT